jgi:hypothetical protein
MRANLSILERYSIQATFAKPIAVFIAGNAGDGEESV